MALDVQMFANCGYVNVLSETVSELMFMYLLHTLTHNCYHAVYVGRPSVNKIINAAVLGVRGRTSRMLNKQKVSPFLSHNTT